MLMKENYQATCGRRLHLRFMIVVVAMCMVTALSVSANAQQNGERFSFVYENTDLLDVLRDVNRRSGNRLMFRVEEVRRENSPVTVNLTDVTLAQGVNQIVAGKNFTVTERDGMLVLVPQQPGQQGAAPQRVTVHGVVTNQLGAPLPGVGIVLKGTHIGFVTDANGRFSHTLTIPAGTPAILQFSFLGMEGVEVPVTDQEMRITMREMATDIGAVVITGIVDKPRESYTGSVTSISRRELQQYGNHSVVSTIQNIDPSFYIADNIQFGSDPNVLPDISIRGSSSLNANINQLQDENNNLANEANLPLFIKDGFEIKLRQLMDLDQNIIDNITILKDASATAMYGTRGANGVIVITTRRPESGSLLVTYNGSLKIEAPDLTSYNLMNSREKLDFELLSGMYNATLPYDKLKLMDVYNDRLMDVERGVDTYWLKYPVRTGVGSSHSLRIEGGTDELLYSANISYDNIAGVMKGSSRNTLNGDMLIWYKFKNVSFQNQLSVAFNKSKNSPYGSFSSYGEVNSYFKPYSDDGQLYKMLESGDNRYVTLPTAANKQYNPLWDAYLPSLDDTRYMQVQNNFEILWDIIPQELTFRGRFSYTKQTNRSDQYTSAEATKFDTWTDERYDRRGEYVYGSGEEEKLEGSLSLNYTKVFNEKHQLFAAIYGNFGQDRNEGYRFTALGISNPNMDYLGMAAMYDPDSRPWATEGISRRLGATANVNYTYDSRYFVDLSGNLEGSSRFGANNRTAPFWSVGAGWNIHRESFMTNVKAINTARVRVSYGTSGAQNFNPYQALLTFRDYGNLTYEGWYGAYLMAMGNDELGWQKTYTLNFGFDLGFFDDRLGITADIFDKRSKDVLADISLPSASGFKSYAANVGELSNRGFDVNLRTMIIRNYNWRWSVGVALRYNKNEILKISDALEELNETMLGEDTENYNPSFLFKEGESLNTIYAVRSLGIDPSNGREIYMKANGELTYEWDAHDKVAIGTRDPKYWGNFNTSIAYKNLTLTAVFSYRWGGYSYNQTLKDRIENIMPYNNADKRAYYDRWTTPGEGALYKRIDDHTRTNATSRFVMKENTLRLTNLSLQYDLRNDWLERNLGLSFLSVTAYMEDVAHFSTIRQERGLDYPFARKFSLSLRLRF